MRQYVGLCGRSKGESRRGFWGLRGEALGLDQGLPTTAKRVSNASYHYDILPVCHRGVGSGKETRERTYSISTVLS